MQAEPVLAAVVGDFFVDIQAEVPQLPVWDGDVETRAIEVLPGGSAANTARQLQALLPGGSEVKLFSTVGDDLLGQAALSRLEAQGFSTKHITRLSQPSSACIVLTGPKDRGFVSCYSTVKLLHPNLIDKAALQSCKHVHVGGYLGLKALHTAEFTALLRSCKEGGATLSLGTNCSPDGLWTGENQHLEGLLPLLDLLLVNERELAEIEKAIGQPLLALSPQLTIVETLGSRGTAVRAPGQDRIVVPALIVQDPVDMAGAGDSFTAGFLARWIAGSKDMKGAAAFGNATASLKVQRRGACAEPIPFSEVQKAFEELSKSL